MCMIGNVAQNW